MTQSTSLTKVTCSFTSYFNTWTTLNCLTVLTRLLPSTAATQLTAEQAWQVQKLTLYAVTRFKVKTNWQWMPLLSGMEDK